MVISPIIITMMATAFMIHIQLVLTGYLTNFCFQSTVKVAGHDQGIYKKIAINCLCNERVDNVKLQNNANNASTGSGGQSQ